MKKIVLVALLLGLGVAFGAGYDIPRLLKQCNANNGKACQNLAASYGNGLGVAKDTSKAFEFAKKACDLNVAEGCFSVGIIYHTEKNDVVKAEKFFAKSCDMNFADGCYDAGYVWSQIAFRNKENESEMRKALAKAIDFYIKACDLGNAISCDSIADTYQVIAQDSTKEEYKDLAKKYRRRACSLGYKEACRDN